MPARIAFAWGDYRFTATTTAVGQYTRQTEQRWAFPETLGTIPDGQHLGPGADTVSLEGVSWPQTGAGIGQAERLRTSAARGETELLIDGMGRVWGRYALTTIAETGTRLMSDGAPRKAEIRLVFQRVRA
jgi:uncharacterized protein